MRFHIEAMKCEDLPQNKQKLRKNAEGDNGLRIKKPQVIDFGQCGNEAYGACSRINRGLEQIIHGLSLHANFKSDHIVNPRMNQSVTTADASVFYRTGSKGGQDSKGTLEAKTWDTSPTDLSRHSSQGFAMIQKPKSRKASHKRALIQRRNKFNGKQLFADTNTIYPRGLAAKNDKDQLQSPQKARPQSGGPSPERRCFEKLNSKSEQKSEFDLQSKLAQLTRQKVAEEFLRKKEEVFKESKEASMALQRAQAELQVTQKEIKEHITNSEHTLNKYKAQMTQFEDNINTKVEKKLEDSHYVQVVEENEDGEKKEKFVEKMDKKVEYKYAFGQKIQADYEWLVAKKKIEKKDEIIFNEVKKEKAIKQFEIVYDINGRARKQRCIESAMSRSTAKSPMASANLTANMAKETVPDVIEEAEAPNAEESPLNIPNWLANPFCDDHCGDEVVQEESQPDEVATPTGKSIELKQKRVQKNIVIRSKNRSAAKSAHKIGNFMETTKFQTEAKKNFRQLMKHDFEYKSFSGLDRYERSGGLRLKSNHSSSCKTTPFRKSFNNRIELKNQKDLEVPIIISQPPIVIDSTQYYSNLQSETKSSKSIEGHIKIKDDINYLALWSTSAKNPFDQVRSSTTMQDMVAQGSRSRLSSAQKPKVNKKTNSITLMRNRSKRRKPNHDLTKPQIIFGNKKISNLQMSAGNKINYANNVLQKVQNENSLGRQRVQNIRENSDNNRIFGTWK